MSEFSELVKQFDKIRSYVRDFYIYGFKTREDYQDKSSRTYDNERRRLESWFSDYIRHDYNEEHKKSVSITLDSNQIAINPLYHAWKAKSFTSNDIMLHFFLLDLLQNGEFQSVECITDNIQDTYGVFFDSQIVRKKLVEYNKEGLFQVKKDGRQNLYGLMPDFRTEIVSLWSALIEGISFFQAAAPFGYIGSTLLDYEQSTNEYFRFKHDYLVHTLEDEILFPLLQAIRQKRQVNLTVKGTKTGILRSISGTPLKFLVSTQTGRRYVCMHTIPKRNANQELIYKKGTRRLSCYRLDSIRKVTLYDIDECYDSYQKHFEATLPYCWGVSFGQERKPETICLRVICDEERELHIVDRLEREGRHGTITRIENGVYEYTRECWDASELLPWIKTFTGRILSFTSSNKAVEQRLWSDLRRMEIMYLQD